MLLRTASDTGALFIVLGSLSVGDLSLLAGSRVPEYCAIFFTKICNFRRKRTEKECRNT